MPFLIVNNELLFFKWRGGESPHDIVLIHGSGADHSHWPEELMDLPDYNIYMLDLPGHGRSSGSGRDSVAAYADAVAGVIDERGLRQVALFGHSLGSAIVLTLALRRPAWLKALVLVGAGARLKVLPSLLEQLEMDFPGAVELICQYLFGPRAAPTLVAAEKQRYLTVDWRLIRNDFLACNQFDVMTRLGEIETPTLVITGSADVLTPVKYGQYLKDQIPHAKLVVIPDAGHMVAREKPQEFIQAVGPWLREQFE
jgi:pimeloyl-ACP methyl ester carboxylesterase